MNYSGLWRPNKDDNDDESEWTWVGNGRSAEHIAKAVVRINSAAEDGETTAEVADSIRGGAEGLHAVVNRRKTR